MPITLLGQAPKKAGNEGSWWNTVCMAGGIALDWLAARSGLPVPVTCCLIVGISAIVVVYVGAQRERR